MTFCGRQDCQWELRSRPRPVGLREAIQTDRIRSAGVAVAAPDRRQDVTPDASRAEKSEH
jgi:hypothetical protein